MVRASRRRAGRTGEDGRCVGIHLLGDTGGLVGELVRRKQVRRKERNSESKMIDRRTRSEQLSQLTSELRPLSVQRAFCEQVALEKERG